MIVDPFTEVLESLWDCLESNSEFANLVKVGNRIRVHLGSTQPYKKQSSDADFPEVVIEPAEYAYEINHSSGSYQVEQNYSVIVTGRSLAVNNSFLPVKAAIFKALVNANMPDYATIGNITGNDSVYQQKENDKNLRWFSTMTIPVMMQFDKDDFLEISED